MLLLIQRHGYKLGGKNNPHKASILQQSGHYGSGNDGPNILEQNSNAPGTVGTGSEAKTDQQAGCSDADTLPSQKSESKEGLASVAQSCQLLGPSTPEKLPPRKAYQLEGDIAIDEHIELSSPAVYDSAEDNIQQPELSNLDQLPSLTSRLGAQSELVQLGSAACKDNKPAPGQETSGLQAGEKHLRPFISIPMSARDLLNPDLI